MTLFRQAIERDAVEFGSALVSRRRPGVGRSPHRRSALLRACDQRRSSVDDGAERAGPDAIGRGRQGRGGRGFPPVAAARSEARGHRAHAGGAPPVKGTLTPASADGSTISRCRLTGDVCQHLHRAARPAHLDAAQSLRVGEPEMDAAIVSRLIARRRRADAGLGAALLVDDTRTTAPMPSPVRPRATQRYRQPVIGVAPVVAQDRRLGVEVGDDDVDVAVVIEIAEGSAAAGGRAGECRPERRGYIDERTREPSLRSMRGG